MFDRLIDVCLQFIQLFQIYTFVDQYERGVMLRCGKFHRRVGPGLRFMLPLGFERLISTNVKPESMVFGVQSIHTADDYAVNVQFGIVFNVTDEHLYLIENENTNSILSTVCAGIIADHIQAASWGELNDPEFSRPIKKAMNKRAKSLGCRVAEVWVMDCSAGAAKKFWHEGIRIGV